METRNVLLLDKIGPQARPILEQAGFTVIETGKGFGKDTAALGKYLAENFPSQNLLAVCLRSGTKLLPEAMPLLRVAGVELIVRFGAGTDNIDLAAAGGQGILVQNTPGCNSKSVAELTIFCALVLCRQAGLAIGSLRALKEVKCFSQTALRQISDETARRVLVSLLEDFTTRLTVTKADCAGSELYGKTIGIIGCCGFIGSKVATRALSLGMNVIGYDTVRDRDIEGVCRAEIPELVARSDFITVHTPLNDATRGLIGKERIAAMKPGVFLLNLARAGIVDVDAVFNDMLSDKPVVAGYATDVDESGHPLFSVANTICLPHIGASTEEAEERCALMGADQVVSWLTETEHIHGVNFRDVSMKGLCRNGQLTVIHRDAPGLIEHLSGYFGNRGINIGPFMTVPGKAGFACSMIGPDEAIGPNVAADLMAINGVIRVICRCA